MKLKEKCIYYNPIKEAYYLVLSISDMIYGRYGDIEKPTNLEGWINQDGTGLRFKIDDIIINRDYIRNYKLDEKDLDKFELVRELADEEFYPMKILIHSRYNWPATIINIHKDMNGITEIVDSIKYKQSEVEKLTKAIRNQERMLFTCMLTDKLG